MRSSVQATAIRGRAQSTHDRLAKSLGYLSLALGAALTAVTAVDVMCASGLGAEKGNRKTALADYSDRSGFPQGLEAARGAARRLTIPQDMKTPKSIRSHQIT